jgi:predicted MFS family arabinose efflux permease
MTAYLDLIRHRRIAALLTAALIARLPFGINALAIVLFLHEQTGSFAVGGVVAGSLMIGAGSGAPITARFVDRRGTRVLLLLAAGNATGLVTLLVLGLNDAPIPLLMTAAAMTGFSYPPSPSVLRARFPDLLRSRPELVQPAYALDSVLLELSFVGGPLLVAIVITLTGPGPALLVSAAAVLIGVTIFVSALPPDPHEEGHVEAKGLLDVLRIPGIATLVLTMLPVGFALGSLEVSIPAFSLDQSHRELAGVLLATLAFSSAAGGFFYGIRPRRSPLAVVHHRLTLVLPLTFIPPLLAPSIPVMALMLIPAGVLIAPIIATRNELASESAPPGTKTEALTWPLTALVAGLSSGTALGGVLIDASGWHASILAAIVGATAGAAIATARRETLRPALATGTNVA